MLRSSKLTFLVLFAALGLTACDSGKDNDTTPVEVGSVETVQDGDARITQAAQAATQFVGTVLPAGSAVSTRGSDTVALSTTPTGSTTATQTTISAIVDASGNPTGQVLLNQTGQAPVVGNYDSVAPSNPAIGATDSKGNKMSLRFDADLNFVSATFTPGTGAGQYSAAYIQQVNTAMATQRDLLGRITIEGKTAKEHGQAIIAALNANKRYSQDATSGDAPVHLTSLSTFTGEETPIEKAAVLSFGALGPLLAGFAAITIIGAAVSQGAGSN